MHYIHRYVHCLHSRSCQGQLVLENLLFGLRQFTWLLFCNSFLSFFSFADPVAVSLLALVLTLYGCSLDFVDPRLLNFHLRPELPESESAELRKEVQQVVAAGMR